MASVRVVVRVNHIGVRKMLGQPFMVREMDRRGQRVQRLGTFTTPYLTGEMSRSWFRFSGVDAAGAATCKIGNRTDHTWFVERGTRNDDGTVRMEARHVVKNALQAAAD